MRYFTIFLLLVILAVTLAAEEKKAAKEAPKAAPKAAPKDAKAKKVAKDPKDKMKPHVGKEEPREDDQEGHYEEDGDDHNAEYDQDQVLGSRAKNEEIDEMDQQAALAELNKLIDQHDKDGDGVITKEELIAWLEASAASLNNERAIKEFPNIDLDKDGKISWAEYVKAVYEMDVADLDAAKHPAKKELIEGALRAKQVWDVADQSKDGFLDKTEYLSFIYPGHFPHMHEIDLKVAMAGVDDNKDGKIDLNEFKGKENDTETIKGITEQFNGLDTNNDTFVDEAEAKPYFIPQHPYADQAKDEADHLIKETDTDADGKLTREEINKQVHLWVGGEIYGQDRHDPSEL